MTAGLLAAGVGIAVLLRVRGFPELPAGHPGPALFPGILGALLVLFGLVLAGQGLRRRAVRDTGAGASAHSERTAPGPRWTRGRVDGLAVLGLIAGYLLLAEILGFVTTMTILLFALMWRLGARPWLAALSAVLTTVLITLVFRYVLLVPLPAGPLGR